MSLVKKILFKNKRSPFKARDTSQNSSNCGHNVAKTLSTRTHKCPHCGYVADRDENAAINILRKATTVGQTVRNA